MELSYPDPAPSDGVVLLRPWSDGDLECVREAATDVGITARTTVPAGFTPEAGLDFISRQRQRIERGEGVALAIADASTGSACGLIALLVRPQPGVMGLGYWVVPSARGQGFGKRAVRLAVRWAMSEVGMARVEAWVEPDNIASQRLLVAAGFRREAVLRSFLSFNEKRADAVVFSRTTHDT